MNDDNTLLIKRGGKRIDAGRKLGTSKFGESTVAVRVRIKMNV